MVSAEEAESGSAMGRVCHVGGVLPALHALKSAHIVTVAES